MHYKRVAIVGLCFAIAALAPVVLFAPSLNFWQAEILIALLGLGVGPLFPTATVSVQNAVDQRDLGIATATLAFLRTFGSAIGVALMGAVVIGFGVVTDARPLADGGSLRSGDWRNRRGRLFPRCSPCKALALAISLACFLRMEERPLRGAAPSARRRWRSERAFELASDLRTT